MKLTRNEELKLQAAQHAVNYISSGMVIGLGHGSTASLAIELIARRVDRGSLRDIYCVPASNNVEKAAQELDLPLTTLNEHPVLDITIDGADEVNLAMEMIKGGGGALMKEKMLAQASRREIIIVDESKLSTLLGMKWALPVEVVDFGWRYQVAFLEQLGAKVKMRVLEGGSPFITDQGNKVLDCDFGPISNPARLAARLNERAGIVEHGLFINLADDLIIAGAQGIRHLKKDINRSGLK
ncbi:MAG: ribose-5-phosphate isomerase RpiA [Bacillota bacterium]